LEKSVIGRVGRERQAKVLNSCRHIFWKGVTRYERDKPALRYWFCRRGFRRVNHTEAECDSRDQEENRDRDSDANSDTTAHQPPLGHDFDLIPPGY
jgi:hypothetical protein